MNEVFFIFADGRKVGLSVAASKEAAIASARRTLSRQTASKERDACDYEHVRVVPMTRPASSASEAGNARVASVLARRLAPGPASGFSHAAAAAVSS